MFIAYNHSFYLCFHRLKDPLVEIEDEDKMFDVLMEFAKADVNSPRSVRALSKVRIVNVMKFVHEFRKRLEHT